MSDNIIDFNQHKHRQGDAPRDDEFSMDSLMEDLDSLPDNRMMASISGYVNERMLQMLSLLDIGRRVTDLLTSIDFNPDDFSLDPVSAERYLSLEDLSDSPTPFNGPFFDWVTHDALVRVATAFHDDGEELQLLIAVMKLPDDADRWQRYGEDGWVDDGPPADFFDDLEDWDDEDDWDDDEDDWDDEPINDWDDEYEASIYSLYLSPQTFRALAAAGIETVKRLAGLTDQELLAIDGIGPKELEIIREALDGWDMEAEE